MFRVLPERIVACLLLVCLPQCVLPSEYPLKVGQSGRQMVDQNNEPFFFNGATPWSLIGQVSKEDADLYLRDSAEKKVNSLIVTLVEGYFADNAPANYYGVQPFTSRGKFTTPNEPYFEHADWVIRKAAEYGMQMIIAPNYLGCCNDGWYDDLRDNNTEADARWYGQWIGSRYKDFPNLMYVWGNDLSPGELRNKIRAMAEGVKSADPNHLQTYHGASESSALDDWPISESWLDFNITYTYQPVQQKVLDDYNRTPFLPFFLFESQYENDFFDASPLQTRKQAYVAVLSGAQGHHYGNYPLWHMNGNPTDPGPNWKRHLNDEGRASLQHIAELFLSRAWNDLVPDQQHRFVVAGVGSGQDYVGAAVTGSKVTGIAYLPDARTITIDLGQLSGSTKKGWWFNPRDGMSLSINLSAFTGRVDVTPPSGGDWVLVVDNATANLPAPGQIAEIVRPETPRNLRAQ